MSIEENAPTDFTLEDEQEMNRYIERSTSYGTKDRSGVHFIIGLLIVSVALVALYGVYNYLSGLTTEKSESVFSLTRDLATFPHGNTWVVAGMAIIFVIRIFMQLLTEVLKSFTKLVLAAADQEAALILWHCVIGLIKIAAVIGLIIGVCYFW